jgi:hypothetical protein
MLVASVIAASLLLPPTGAFSFAFVGNVIWICHLYNLICKKIMLLLVLIFFVSIGNLPLWQFDLPIPIAFSFAFVGNGFWIGHFGNLICKKVKLPFDLILFVSIGNLICIKKFDLLTQLRFIFAVLAKMIRKTMMLLFVLILFVLPT